MGKRMMDFNYKFNILNSNQLGFLPDHNTSDALLQFLGNAYEPMNNNKVLPAIFHDFPKAIDTVDQKILMRQLDFFGFIGKTLQ